MKAGKYCFKELFVNRYVEQIIVPEIQRDYVWEKTQVEGLLSSLVDDYKAFKSGQVPSYLVQANLSPNDAADIEALKTFYKKRKFASNIGFIYAYNDASYPGKYFLIDGQQRITTLYLVLVTLVNRNREALKLDFEKYYMLNKQPKIGYKVRLESDEILNNFVSHVIESDDDVQDQRWLLYSYENDLTSKNLLENYKVIQNYFDEEELEDESDFYHYLEELTEFWYFDTNVSEQGEELYIYMNARGEQMQSNENLKADLLSRFETIEEKNEYGRKWEEWQDFFWKHKGAKNQTADIGFNQFLTCIAGLEYYLKGNREIFYQSHGKEVVQIKMSDVLFALDDIKKIEAYFEVFKTLVSKAENFKASRAYSGWVDKALSDFWDLFNSKSFTNWFADYTDENRSTERRNMVFAWSVFHYLMELSKDDSALDLNNVFRVFRKYYLSFNNNIRSVTSIKENINQLLEYGVWSLSEPSLKESSSDEDYKKILLERFEGEDKYHAEELIWEIEDHPFNLNGQDVGNINFSHLMYLGISEISIPLLEKVKDKFYEIFPSHSEEKNASKLIHLLLKEGVYYDQVSPLYYVNYKMNDWRRVIRNLSNHNNRSSSNCFMNIFQDFCEFDKSFNKFYKTRTKEKISITDVDNQNDRILWYCQELGDKMWSEGFFVAISLGINRALPGSDTNDDVFTSENKFYNTKGNLKGGNPQILSELINQEIYVNH